MLVASVDAVVASATSGRRHAPDGGGGTAASPVAVPARSYSSLHCSGCFPSNIFASAADGEPAVTVGV